MEEAKTPEKWLKQFYAEIDAIKRRKYLDKLLVLKYDEEDCQKLSQLWDLRYKNSKQGVSDSFMGAWLELNYVADNMNSVLRVKNNKKLIQKALMELCIVGDNHFPEQMLYKELKNLLFCYITVSLKDFRQKILGVKIRTEQKTVERRIEETVIKITTVLPQKFGLEKEFSLLTCAANEALRECLSKYEPNELI